MTQTASIDAASQTMADFFNRNAATFASHLKDGFFPIETGDTTVYIRDLMSSGITVPVDRKNIGSLTAFKTSDAGKTVVNQEKGLKICEDVRFLLNILDHCFKKLSAIKQYDDTEDKRGTTQPSRAKTFSESLPGVFWHDNNIIDLFFDTDVDDVFLETTFPNMTPEDRRDIIQNASLFEGYLTTFYEKCEWPSAFLDMALVSE